MEETKSQQIKNTIQMLYYVIKTYKDCGISREDINALDELQQEKDDLKESIENKWEYQQENIPNKSWSEAFKSGYMCAWEELTDEVLNKIKGSGE